MATITQKQEEFCQAIISGSSQSEAYRSAYSTANMKNKTVNEEACAIMKSSTIINRIAELRAPAVKKAGMTLESHLEDLQRLRNMAVTSNTRQRLQPRPAGAVPQVSTWTRKKSERGLSTA